MGSLFVRFSVITLGFVALFSTVVVAMEKKDGGFSINGVAPKEKAKKFVAEEFKNCLSNINNAIIKESNNQINGKIFGGNKAYFNTLDNYSKKYSKLLGEIVDSYIESTPLVIDGKRIKKIKDLIVVLEFGSGVHGLRTEDSDLEFVIAIDDTIMHIATLLWLSGLIEKLAEIGFKLDKENLYPPVISKKDLSVKAGSMFAVGNLFHHYGDILLERDKRFENHYLSGKFYGLFGDSIAGYDNKLKKLYSEAMVKPVEEIKERKKYILDPAGQMLENIFKTMRVSKVVYGNAELAEKHNKLIKELLAQKLGALAPEQYQGLTFSKYFLENLAFSYKKFFGKKISPYINKNMGKKSHVKNVIYRTLNLILLNYELLVTHRQDMDWNVFDKAIVSLKNYVSYVRMNENRKLCFDKEVFDKTFKDMLHNFNQILLGESTPKIFIKELELKTVDEEKITIVEKIETIVEEKSLEISEEKPKEISNKLGKKKFNEKKQRKIKVRKNNSKKKKNDDFEVLK